ncbi:hypothetical protein WJ32_08315 [Burkholderia ubonensis]|uniref:Uncharacterized protein n=1 Tax=Burkholderia ubonensis TaxID=101571 RepID=A0A103QVM9_9BURK|nr:hypothetical protein [Burkholderia ubonensis]AOJ62460.1 hypothetical protein WJ32_08315 [Burkholderia ubonensis]KVG56423.1 hypothetical protein WJ33_36980 [Burkholderia ubonensis]
MRMTLRCAFSAVLIAFTAPVFGQSTYSAPFDFHGIKLGSTMAQFAAAAPPEFSTASSQAPHAAQPVCSDSGKTLPHGIHVDPVDEQYGGGACGWGFDLLGNGDLYAATFRVGDSAGMGVFRYIAMPGDGNAKLYHIHIQVQNDSMASVIDGLTAKFGPPSEKRTEPWQNKIGGRFDNTILVWKNSTSQITVRQFALSVDEGSIDYILLDHYRFKQSLKQVSDSSRNGRNM